MTSISIKNSALNKFKDQFRAKFGSYWHSLGHFFREISYLQFLFLKKKTATLTDTKTNQSSAARLALISIYLKNSHDLNLTLILLDQDPGLRQTITNLTQNLLSLKNSLTPNPTPHPFPGKVDFIITWNQYNLFLANNPTLPIGNGQTKDNFLITLTLFGYY